MPRQVRGDRTINQDVESACGMSQQVRGDGMINQDVESACGMPRKMRGRRRQVRGGRNVPKGKEKK
jgi:hypothetical protein